jgi:phenylalanine-4-hydroxylase
MGKGTTYVSRQPDRNGYCAYTPAEDAIWAELYARQRRAVEGKACAEFVRGLDVLQLPTDRVPQLPEINRALRRETGWEVAQVPALIPFGEFFQLLSEKKFPAATFIRTREELDYLEEPDIFHELFGHAPMLTNPFFAEFTHTYGKLGLAASDADREFLARLYWFTLEFGLIRKPGSPLQIYGGGILSSIGETDYAVNSSKPVRKRFDVMEALRTPYRIDIMQPQYFVLEDLRELNELTRMDLMGKVAEARKLGLHAPLYADKAA